MFRAITKVTSMQKERGVSRQHSDCPEKKTSQCTYPECKKILHSNGGRGCTLDHSEEPQNFHWMCFDHATLMVCPCLIKSLDLEQIE